MNTPLARTVRKPKQAIGRRLPQRRDDSGLTTLEWLLIVAAVAGLAALAVVLVQNVIGETSEQIAGSSARKTAAQVAAAAVVEESKVADVTDPDFDSAGKWDNYFTAKCNRIGIVFSDADVTMAPLFDAAAGYTAVTILAADAAAATAAKAQASCVAN